MFFVFFPISGSPACLVINPVVLFDDNVEVCLVVLSLRLKAMDIAAISHDIVFDISRVQGYG